MAIQSWYNSPRQKNKNCARINHLLPQFGYCLIVGVENGFCLSDIFHELRYLNITDWVSISGAVWVFRGYGPRCPDFCHAKVFALRQFLGQIFALSSHFLINFIQHNYLSGLYKLLMLYSRTKEAPYRRPNLSSATSLQSCIFQAKNFPKAPATV